MISKESIKNELATDLFKVRARIIKCSNNPKETEKLLGCYYGLIVLASELSDALCD